MTAFRTLTIIAALAGAASTATAQIVPIAEAGPYKIMQVEDREICFAAVELLSQAEKPMIFSYYATSEGQRWNVAGFASEMELEDGDQVITVTIDGVKTVSRATETRGGDFLLPFEALPEIEAHEVLVKTGETMTISVGEYDTLEVDLGDHRAALEALATCLADL